MEDKKSLTYVLLSIINGIKDEHGDTVLNPQTTIKQLAEQYKKIDENGNTVSVRHSTMSSKIHRANTMAFSKVVELLDKLGYEIIIQKKQENRTPESFYMDADGNWQYCHNVLRGDKTDVQNTQ